MPSDPDAMVKRARASREKRRGWKASPNNLDTTLAAFAREEVARKLDECADQMTRIANSYSALSDLAYAHRGDAQWLRAEAARVRAGDAPRHSDQKEKS